MNQIGGNQPGRLLSIGQLTTITGVGRSTIRHWEHQFRDFLISVRTSGNQRRFPADAVGKVEKIKELVEEQGLTLRGARQKLEQFQRQLPPEASQPAPESDVSLKKLADLMSEHIIRRLFQDR